ncbi:MAG: hypothetical protein K8T26_18825 [Lentisphaerae bacterium]|nr:hypothetical protein [Lentisphaerota bacterium]
MKRWTVVMLALVLGRVAAAGPAAPRPTPVLRPSRAASPVVAGAVATAAPAATAVPAELPGPWDHAIDLPDWTWPWPEWRPGPEGWSVGTRLTAYTLTDSRGEPIVGHIDRLDAEQDLLPYKLFAQWRFHPNVGLELTWDRVRAQTLNEPNANRDRVSDGSFEAQGPLLTVFGQYLTDTPCTPFLGVGVGWMMASFDADAWWANGYASPEEWESLGRPDASVNTKTRHMDPSDNVALIVTGGCSYALPARWAADVYVRYMSLDIENHYTIYVGDELVNDNGHQQIPMSNVAGGVGLKRSF